MTTTECGRYLTADGERELVLLAAAEGTRLLVDRRVNDGTDARLLAHLAVEEPDANAWIVCGEFLADEWRSARPLRADDFVAAPEGVFETTSADVISSAALADANGYRYVLRPSGSPPELRWEREPRRPCSAARRMSARDVIAALEDYEPVCSLTRAAVAEFRADRRISVSTLAVELRRIETSPIVLNRRLREAVLSAVRDGGTSLSAIAMACGRIKHDHRGNGSGETSWLARRVGLLPSSAGQRPNPWVHSDTLALIARNGLGLAPREVELP